MNSECRDEAFKNMKRNEVYTLPAKIKSNARDIETLESFKCGAIKDAMDEKVHLLIIIDCRSRREKKNHGS